MASFLLTLFMVALVGAMATALEEKTSSANATANCSEMSPDTCPPGLFCKEGRCECGTEYPQNIIRCNGTSSFVLKFYCASFDADRNLTMVGACGYQWYYESRNKLCLLVIQCTMIFQRVFISSILWHATSWTELAHFVVSACHTTTPWPIPSILLVYLVKI